MTPNQLRWTGAGKGTAAGRASEACGKAMRTMADRALMVTPTDCKSTGAMTIVEVQHISAAEEIPGVPRGLTEMEDD